MENKILSILKELRERDIENVYSSIKNFFDYQNFPFQVVELVSPYKFLFRVRRHESGEDFFNNESDVSYRKDFLNIKSYGRCNEPLQSMFYCSDSNLLSFCEVSKYLQDHKSVPPVYHTTSVWRVNRNVRVTYLLENQSNEFLNKELLNMTLKFKNEIIANPNLIGDKIELIEFLHYISDEFRIKHAKTADYFLSAAYSNYLFSRVTEDNKSIVGIIYPTCLGEAGLINTGLNHAFNPDVVGFDKAIELFDVYRSTITVTEGECNELEVVHCKNINRTTGKISW
ncbi:hypothetical protein [Mucilaginibacter sp. HD30]